MKIWVVDTGSIIQIRREIPNSVRNKVTTALDVRVTDGSLIYPPEVVGEMERLTDEISKKGPDEPFVWAKKNEERATRDGHLYAEAKAVIKRVGNTLVDHEKVSVGGVDDADPYVIALAVKMKGEGHEVTIITEDVNSKPKKMALADAAGVMGIPCVRFRTFLITEAIWDGREGT